MALNDIEQACLAAPRLCQPATVAPKGVLQHQPVSFQHTLRLGTVDESAFNLKDAAAANAAMEVRSVVGEPWLLAGSE